MEQVSRERMELRAGEPEPPPDREEIRRQLGWHLLPQNRQPYTREEHDEHRG